MPSFTFKNLLRSPRRTEAEVKSIVNDFPTPPVSPGLRPPDAARTPAPPHSPSLKGENDNRGVYNRWNGRNDTGNRPTRKTSSQSLRNEMLEREVGLRPRTAVSGAKSQASFHKPSEDVVMMPLPLKLKEKPTYTLSRPSNIAVPPKNLLGLPSGLSPKEERAREKGGEMEELAAVARMLSGESSRPIKKTTLEIGGMNGGGGLGSGGSGSGRGRLSPGVRMPGSPGFTEDEMRDWERKGLNMLE